MLQNTRFIPAHNSFTVNISWRYDSHPLDKHIPPHTAHNWKFIANLLRVQTGNVSN